MTKEKGSPKPDGCNDYAVEECGCKHTERPSLGCGARGCHYGGGSVIQKNLLAGIGKFNDFANGKGDFECRFPMGALEIGMPEKEGLRSGLSSQWIQDHLPSRAGRRVSKS